MTAGDLLAGLNERQRQAVTCPESSVMVLAGAGSGKTRVLTTRIAWLIRERGYHPSQVLAVTFTNKAANEMRERLGRLVATNVRQMWIGTFHGLCNRLLRRFHSYALPALPRAFTILDTADQLAASRRTIEQANIDSAVFTPERLSEFVNQAKAYGLRPGQMNPTNEYDARMIPLYEAYQRLCNREGLVDFAELLLRCYEMMRADGPPREYVRSLFRTLLVDEFQDTSRLQYAWLGEIRNPRTPIFAVADDDQLIYGWRLAEPKNVHDFVNDYARGDIIRLEQNYRSTATILAAANEVIRNNPDRLGKTLFTEGARGSAIEMHALPDDYVEADFIAREIDQSHAAGAPYRDHALLYRSNHQSRQLEKALIRRAIPYTIYGGLRFFDRQEIKHCLAYLRLAANRTDENALLRILNFPPRGIGARTIDSLRAAAAERTASLWETASEEAQARSASKIAVFVRMIEGLSQAMQDKPLAEQVKLAMVFSGLQEHYSTKDGEEGRLDNLLELVSAAHDFEAEWRAGHDVADDAGPPDPYGALESFLAGAALESAVDRGEGERGDAVQLMTIHASKGLEFPTVYLTGCETGLMPHIRSVLPAQVQEERRLMYVALTRARTRLCITYCRFRQVFGRTEPAGPSPFIEEIPSHLTVALDHCAQSGVHTPATG